MKYLYRIYELCVVIPIFLVYTILLGLATIIGCAIGSGNFWGYWPGHLWAWVTCASFAVARQGGRQREP
jgi:1-acyl-sn-glycerol-3-phosphate acyltransferase